jgi:hypothetical protein
LIAIRAGTSVALRTEATMAFRKAKITAALVRELNRVKRWLIPSCPATWCGDSTVKRVSTLCGEEHAANDTM